MRSTRIVFFVYLAGVAAGLAYAIAVGVMGR
jgi:hypothetical protein